MVCQIYYIKTPKEALEVVEAGADYIGLTPYQPKRPKSPVTYEVAKEIIRVLDGRAVVTVLSTFDEPEKIIDMAEQIRPNIIQISGTTYFADAELVKTLKERVPGIKVMQAIPMTGPRSVEFALKEAQFVDYLILDSVAATPEKAGGVIGAAGVAHDWTLSRKIVEESPAPVMLAGGLGPDNVAAAIRAVRPWGVDSLTKTNRFLFEYLSIEQMHVKRQF